uniref:TPM_phosphatase domain-containing protein n=1 Tax=Caenorhabditis tropicalis TaxID=1561998 RepID=A0A1I7U402_9PELO
MKWQLIFLLIFLGSTSAKEWDAYNFPNPTAGQFQECKMRTTANICDPDGVLSEQSRYRLDHDLKQLETRTRQDNARTFCDKKGVTAAMAVARHVKGGTTEDVETMANDMLNKWTLDPQCKKAVVIVVSTDDMKFWVARDTKVPVYADEFTQIFMQQKSLFQQGNYQQALTNILQATWDKALSKQGSPRQPNRGNQGPGNQGNGGQGSGGKPGGGFKMPSIPAWFWLLLLGVVIPTLCCCCCIYCCCCRGRGGGGGNQNRQQVPTDPMGGGGYPQPPPQQRGGGGAGGMFRNILSSGGGAAAGSMLGRFLSNRGGGGGGSGMGGGNRGYGFQGSGAGGNQGGDAPVYDDNGGQGGGGLYPSQEVKDRGGGGSWA